MRGIIAGVLGCVLGFGLLACNPQGECDGRYGVGTAEAAACGDGAQRGMVYAGQFAGAGQQGPAAYTAMRYFCDTDCAGDYASGGKTHKACTDACQAVAIVLLNQRQ